MKPHNLSHGAFSASPIFISEMCTAHSGPELVSSIPQTQLANELAQALLSDHTQLVQNSAVPSFSSAVNASIFIGLSRR